MNCIKLCSGFGLTELLLLEEEASDLQTDVSVLHTLLRQAGDGEGLAVVFKVQSEGCSGLGSEDFKQKLH